MTIWIKLTEKSGVDVANVIIYTGPIFVQKPYVNAFFFQVYKVYGKSPVETEFQIFWNRKGHFLKQKITVPT